MSTRTEKRLIFCIGMHGPFVKWAIDMVIAAAGTAHAHGHADLRWVGAEDDVCGMIDQQGGRPLVIATNVPGRPLLDALRRGHARVLAFVEDPLDATAFLQRSGPMSSLEAVRMCQTSLITSFFLRSHSDCHFIYRKDIAARDQVAAILAHMSLGLSDAAEHTLLEKFGGKPDDGWTLETALSRQVEHYAPPMRAQVDCEIDSEATAIARAIDPLIRMVMGAPLEPIVWTPGMVFHGPQNEPLGTRMIELVGPPRALLRGPFVPFPPGRYRVTLSLDFEEEAMGLPFAIELHWGSDGKRLVGGRAIEPEHIGRQAGSFEVVLDHPEEVVDVRVKLCTPLLDDGRIKFLQLEFLPLQS